MKKQYNVRASVVRLYAANKPVGITTIIPAIEAADKSSFSDEVTLQPGQWLEIVKHGTPESWSEAIIRP